MPHLLRHGTSVFKVISERPVIPSSECRALGEEAVITTFLNVLGLTRSARAGLELTTSRMLSESNTTRLLDHFVTLKGDLEVGHSPVFSVLNKVLLQGNIIFRVNKAIVTVLRHSVT